MVFADVAFEGRVALRRGFDEERHFVVLLNLCVPEKEAANVGELYAGGESVFEYATGQLFSLVALWRGCNDHAVAALVLFHARSCF